MPYVGSTKVPPASSEDAGVVVDAIIKGGRKYYGKTVTLVGSLLPEEEKLKIWADGTSLYLHFAFISADGVQLWA
jgi:hypothetical protein